MDSMERKKEIITEELSKQYSLNTISLEEYERMVEYAHNIETEKECVVLEKIVYEHNAMPGNGGKKETGARRGKNHYTILSSRRISGSMLSEMDGTLITVLGDSHIVINDEDSVSDETVMRVVTVLGDTVIHIPDTLTVINKAVPVLGGIFGDEKSGNGRHRKILIIEGKVILGNITIKRDEVTLPSPITQGSF